MENAFLYTSYYAMLLMVVAWGWASWHHWYTYQIQPRVFFSKIWLGALVALGLTLAIWKGVGPSYKVLADESNLMGVARSMYLDHTVKHILQAEHYYDNLWPISIDTPKRPFIYPLFVSFFHVLFGYSISNGFYLNALTLFILLCWVFALVRYFAGPWVGVAAQLLVAAQPIIGIIATSAGYDLLSLLLTVILMTGMLQLLQNPTPLKLLFLWWTGLVLAHVRYENIIFLPLLFGCLFIWKLIRWSDLMRYKWHYVLGLILCIPRVLQAIIKEGTYENPPGVPVLGFVNFQKHFPIFLENLFDFTFTLPYATFLTLVTCIVIVCEALRILYKKSVGKRSGWDQVQTRWAISLFLVTISGLIIYLSHHFGRFEHPTQARLFVVFVIMTSLVSLLSLRWIPLLHIEKAKKWTLVIGAICFTLYFPVAAEGRFVNRLVGIRTANATLGFFHKLPTHNIMIIADTPGLYVVEEFGSVNFQYARQNTARLVNNLKRHLYQDMYMIEQIEYGKTVGKEGGLPGVTSEVVHVFQLSATEFIQISRVKADKTDVEVPHAP